MVLLHRTPDDESMFFSPLLQFAADNRRRVSVLCLSTGDFDGLGQQRQVELVQACGVFGVCAEEVTVLDDARLRDGMHELWPPEEVARLVLARLLLQPPDMVIPPASLGSCSHVLLDAFEPDPLCALLLLQIATFDEHGVSGHPNHIAVSQGVVLATQRFQQQRLASRPPRHDEESGPPAPAPALLGVMLDSTNVFRKFLGPLDIGLSLLQARLGHCGDRGSGQGSVLAVLNSRPWRVYLAMAAHHSQFVWFRRLFVCFSRFTFVNTFRVFHK